MSIIDTLRISIGELCEIVDSLASDFPAPRTVQRGDGYVDRHEAKYRTNGLACYLKAVKVCSTLNGALVLLDHQHVQEAYALCRIAQDQVDDIHFLVIPRGDGDTLTARQQTSLDEFFQEEFADHTDPIGTSQERLRVSRDKIRAAIHGDPGISDPSTAQRIGKVLYRMFSGYIHGAYVHIMELGRDVPGRYHFRGTPGTRLSDAIEYFPNFIFQATLAVEQLADRSSRDDLVPRVRALRADLAAKYDLLPNKT